MINFTQCINGALNLQFSKAGWFSSCRDMEAIEHGLFTFNLTLRGMTVLTILAKITRLHVPRHGRQLDHEPIKLLGHLHLAAQAARLGEAKGQVQHIILIILWLRHLVVVALVLDDDVAGRACAGSPAGALHLKIVGLSDIQQVVALAYSKLVVLAILVNESHIEPGHARLAGTIGSLLTHTALLTPLPAWAYGRGHVFEVSSWRNLGHTRRAPDDVIEAAPVLSSC